MSSIPTGDEISEAGGGQASLREIRCGVLFRALSAHGFEPQLCGERLEVPGSPPLIVRCGPRTSDAGTLWFHTQDGTPLSEAGDIAGALTAIKAIVHAAGETAT